MQTLMRTPMCFVIMPYGRRPVEDVEIDFDVIFDELIAPAARAARFHIVRSDREVASGVIMRHVFSFIYSADLVVADITYQNPNVYYELGVRHALRPHGTLLIRRTGGDLGVRPLSPANRGAAAAAAFDIEGVTFWSYDVTQRGLPSCVDELRLQMERVSNAVVPDSPAYLYLDGLRVVTGAPRAHSNDDGTYEIMNGEGEGLKCYVGYRSGDLKDLRGERAVDFWVNSENVLMQMARIYERSVSATIRYLGAVQPDPNIPGFDDTIAVALAAKLGGRNAVNQGEVLATTSGRLRETHGVKAILHAAAVTGAPGRGYQSISEDLLVEMARTVLSTARELIRERGAAMTGRSLIMPLFGTGQGRLDPSKGTERLLYEVIQDLSYHATRSTSASPGLEVVLFSAFTEDHVKLMRRFFDALVEKKRLRRAP